MANQTSKELVITRVFDAPRELVWKAWTEPEMFKKWWGPKDYTAPDVNMEVRQGGRYHASMQGPDGNKIWSIGTYREIVPMEKLVVTDSFSDEEGNILKPEKFGMNPDFPKELEVTITFEEHSGKTKLTIRYAPPSAAALKAMEESGMKEGWNESLDKLAESLK